MKNNLVIKDVEFYGTQLLAVQEKDMGDIFTSINHVFSGLGFLEEYQIRYQRDKWLEDKVISKGVRKFSHPSGGGMQETLCINIKKLPLALAKINITPKMETEMPELASVLEKYQDECADILAAAFLSKIVRKKPKDISVRQHLNIADSLIRVTGVKKEIAYAVAIDEAEKETGEDLSAYKKLLPSADHETGFLNPTMIGQQISMKPQEVNLLLQQLGFQYKDEKKDWRITEQGKIYGEEFPYKRNNHTGYQIRWDEKVVSAILESLKSIA